MGLGRIPAIRSAVTDRNSRISRDTTVRVDGGGGGRRTERTPKPCVERSILFLEVEVGTTRPQADDGWL